MASVTVECQTDDGLSPAELDRLAGVLEAAVDSLEADSTRAWGEVSCLIVGAGRISELHREYFNDPSETDVITFPASDDPNVQRVEGDIVVCLDVARGQALEAGHSTLREVAFLGVHGLLHLNGWTDRTAAMRDAMLLRQEAMLRDIERSSGRL